MLKRLLPALIWVYCLVVPAHADLIATTEQLAATCFKILRGSDEISPPAGFDAVPEGELEAFRQEAAHAYTIRLATTSGSDVTPSELPQLVQGSAETLSERADSLQFFRGMDDTGLLVSKYVVPDSLSYVECLFWAAKDPEGAAEDLLRQLRFFPRKKHLFATSVSVYGSAPVSDDGFSNIVSMDVYKPSDALRSEKWPRIVVWLGHEASK